MQQELSLFVYGSLSEGMVHFKQIREYIVEQVSAKAQGQMYRLPSGYPVFLQPTEDSLADVDTISGMLTKLKAPEIVLNLLNSFHGVSPLAPEKSLYFKDAIQVQTDCGTNHSCFVYAMNRAKLPKAAARIENGDWQQDILAKPLLANTLSERQASYIKKLSQSTGREIVPIDINLYRELMKLELIVDKGRRLALSKLGKEVALFLP